MIKAVLMLFIFCALTFLATPQSVNYDKTLNYWKSFYPSVPIPSIISERFSKLSDQKIDAVASKIHQKSFSSLQTLYCNTAGLVCPQAPFEIKVRNCGIYSHGSINQKRDVSRGTFFRELILKNGTRFDVGNIELNQVLPRAFLPHSIASLLTLEQSSVLFKDTNVSNMVATTMNHCNTDIQMETKKCVSSVEELVQFPVEIFGDRRLKIVHAKSNAGAHTTVLLENIRPLLHENPNAKIISCHGLFFPYIVMYCHSTFATQIYSVDFVHPETQKKVNDGMLALCHRNTTYWNPNEPVFSTLETHPGDGEICHWLPPADFAWVHLDDTLAGY